MNRDQLPPLPDDVPAFRSHQATKAEWINALNHAYRLFEQQPTVNYDEIAKKYADMLQIELRKPGTDALPPQSYYNAMQQRHANTARLRPHVDIVLPHGALMPSNIRSDVFGVNPKVPWEVNAIDVLFLKGCGISPK